MWLFLFCVNKSGWISFIIIKLWGVTSEIYLKDVWMTTKIYFWISSRILNLGLIHIFSSFKISFQRYIFTFHLFKLHFPNSSFYQLVTCPFWFPVLSSPPCFLPHCPPLFLPLSILFVLTPSRRLKKTQSGTRTLHIQFDCRERESEQTHTRGNNTNTAWM